MIATTNMPTINLPSICIPRVMYFVEEEMFHEVFTEIFGPNVECMDPETGYGESCVKRVDMVLREDHKTKEPFFLVFIHFNPVQLTPHSQYFAEEMDNGREIRLPYYKQYYWKVNKNTGSVKVPTTPTNTPEEQSPVLGPLAPHPNQRHRVLTPEDVEDIRQSGIAKKLENEFQMVHTMA